MKGSWQMVNREYPKVKIDKGVKMSHPRPYGQIQHFYQQIEKMVVGDSFEITGKYQLSSSVRAGFKRRGWICQMICQGRDPKGGFKMRFWRVA